MAAGTAGCVGLVRQNDVPGGLKFRNQRPTEQRVLVEAFLLPAQTPDDATPTPVDGEPVNAGQFRLPAETTAINDGFFADPGTYLVAATNQDTTVRRRIKLFQTVGGGVGVDTVIVTLPNGGSIQMRVTDVD